MSRTGTFRLGVLNLLVSALFAFLAIAAILLAYPTTYGDQHAALFSKAR